jgi:hypothetical protein
MQPDFKRDNSTSRVRFDGKDIVIFDFNRKIIEFNTHGRETAKIAEIITDFCRNHGFKIEARVYRKKVHLVMDNQYFEANGNCLEMSEEDVNHHRQFGV